LGQAAEHLQVQEAFSPAELLDAQPWLAGWSWQAEPREAWSAMNQWGLWYDKAPQRTQALAQALHMLMADIMISGAASRARDHLAPQEIWRPGVVAQRLRLYYWLAAWGSPPGAPAQTVGLGVQPASSPPLADEEEAQRRVARRWEAELLPMAIGLVLSGARLVVPGEIWRQLAQGGYNSRLCREPLSRQGRQLVEQINEVLPEAVALLHERFRGIFREVDLSHWEHLKPGVEELAMIIRARLYSRGPAKTNGDQEACQAPELAAPPEDGQQAAEAFLKSFRALVAKGLQDKVSLSLAALDQELTQGRDKELLAAVQGWVGEEGGWRKLRDLLAPPRPPSLCGAGPSVGAPAVAEPGQEAQTATEGGGAQPLGGATSPPPPA
jgi:hypothetical protein